MKHFYVQYNIGKARYVLNIHIGMRHADGSPFYDIELPRTRKALATRIIQLVDSGYTEKK